MGEPVRIQRKRTRGWKMPPDTVYVGRPTRWGNPCRAGMFRGYDATQAVADFRRWLARDPSVRSFENAYGKPPAIADIKRELRGKNLACWCPVGTPCHADVLLEIAGGRGASVLGRATE